MSQVTRYHCPLGACDWAHDDPGPAVEIDSDPEALALSHAVAIDGIIREHLETHPLEEWAAEVVRHSGLAPAPVPDLAAVPWRQGRRKGRNLYAVTGPDWEAHPPIGCLDTAELAAEAVAAHNAGLAHGTAYGDLLWLMDMGLEVRLIPDRGRVEAVVSEHLAPVGTVDGEGIADALAAARTMAEEAGCGRPA